MSCEGNTIWRTFYHPCNLGIIEIRLKNKPFLSLCGPIRILRWYREIVFAPRATDKRIGFNVVIVYNAETVLWLFVYYVFTHNAFRRETEKYRQVRT